MALGVGRVLPVILLLFWCDRSSSLPQESPPGLESFGEDFRLKRQTADDIDIDLVSPRVMIPRPPECVSMQRNYTRKAWKRANRPIIWRGRVSWVWYGGHFQTFDKKRYQVLGFDRWAYFECHHVLVQSCHPSLPSFRILSQVHYYMYAAYPIGVTMEVYGYTIYIRTDARNMLQVNGKDAYFGQTYRDHSDPSRYVTLFQVPGAPEGWSRETLGIYTDFGVLVLINEKGLLMVGLSKKKRFRRKICGLMGNFDGKPDNDFTKPDGTITENGMEFRRSWMDNSSTGCSELSSLPGCEPSKALQLAKEKCGVIGDPDGPFHHCHDVMPPDDYIKTCIDGYCYAAQWPLSTQEHCRSVLGYATECERQTGIPIDYNRLRKLLPRCGVYCYSSNDRYSYLAVGRSPCRNTCLSPDLEKHCPKNAGIISGCKCRHGYVLSGFHCLPRDDCGCLDDNCVFHPAGVAWQEGCDRLCRCEGQDDMVCEDFPCPAHATCSGDVCVPTKQTCTVTEVGLLNGPSKTNYQLEKDSEHIFAEKGVGSDDPCRAVIKITTDDKGHVKSAEVNLGVDNVDKTKYKIVVGFNVGGVTGITLNGTLVDFTTVEAVQLDQPSVWPLKGVVGARQPQHLIGTYYISFNCYTQTALRVELNHPDDDPRSLYRHIYLGLWQTRDWRGTCMV